MTRPLFALPALAASLVAFVVTGSAHAFCQSNSCDPARGEDCSDLDGCLTGGVPLAWVSSCVTFSVYQGGSPLNGIEAPAFESAIQTAFETWRNADCGEGTRPSIDVTSIGAVECNEVQYNKDQGNSNIYMFRDDDWSGMSSDALALTTVFYDWKTGEIYDADVEINGTEGNITNGAPEDGADLLSIVTHESGHFLGLAHSNSDPLATMRRSYDPMVDSLRELSQDDIDGICTVYPSDREPAKDDCGPRHGFSSSCWKEKSDGCDCASTPGRPSDGAGWLLLGVAFAGALSRRRRRNAP